MNKRTAKSAFCAVMSVFALSAKAVTQDIPTPPPSEYADTESQIDVAVTNGPAYGRRVKLTLSANFTPSNCVQVALGQDADSDGDLAPEETHLVLGVDCGEPFVREEVEKIGGGGQWNVQISSAETEQEPNFDCSPSPSTFTFRFKQPPAVSSRMNFAKVTIRGRGNSAAQIALEIFRPGTALLLR